MGVYREDPQVITWVRNKYLENEDTEDYVEVLDVILTGFGGPPVGLKAIGLRASNPKPSTPYTQKPKPLNPKPLNPKP